MTLKYTAISTSAIIVSTDLNSLAVASTSVGGVLGSTAYDNSVETTGRFLLANFEVFINTQGVARTGSPQVSLIIVPAVAGNYPDTSQALRLAQFYIAKTAAGAAATWLLDLGTSSRLLTVANIVLPNSAFKVGLINETTQALAGSGNLIRMSDWFSYADV